MPARCRRLLHRQGPARARRCRGRRRCAGWRHQPARRCSARRSSAGPRRRARRGEGGLLDGVAEGVVEHRPLAPLGRPGRRLPGQVPGAGGQREPHRRGVFRRPAGKRARPSPARRRSWVAGFNAQAADGTSSGQPAQLRRPACARPSDTQRHSEPPSSPPGQDHPQQTRRAPAVVWPGSRRSHTTERLMTSSRFR
jgi:hypothetical protein